MSTAGDTLSSVAAIFKQHYDAENLVFETYTDNPAWAMLLKDQDLVPNAGGSVFVHPIVVGSSMGRSATFSVAQNNPSSHPLGFGKPGCDCTMPVHNNQPMNCSGASKTNVW